jgi:hypothetical protein
MSDTTFSSEAAIGPAYSTVHAVPAAESHTACIRLTNRDPVNPIAVRVAICPAAYVAGSGVMPDDADWIESLDVVIEGGGMIEEIAMLLAHDEKVVALAGAASCTVRVDGFKGAATDVVVSRTSVAAGVYATIHTVGAGQSQVANIRTVNRDSVSQLAMRLAICPPGYVDGNPPALSDYIEAPAVVIEGGGLIENMGKALKAGEKIVAYSNLAKLTTRVAALQE